MSSQKLKDSLLEYGDDYGEIGNFGDYSTLKKIFVEPWKDARNAVIGSIARLGNKTRSAIEVVLRGLPSLIVPWLSTDYRGVFAREDQRMLRIEQKYGEAFRAARELFKGDAALVAFMLNPVMMTTIAAGRESPALVLDLLGAIAGDSRLVIDKTHALDSALKTIQRTSSLRRAKRAYGFEAVTRHARVIKERARSEANAAVAEVISDPQVQRELHNSKVVMGIRRDAQAMINQSLNQILKLARETLEVNTLDDLGSLIKNKLPLENLEKVPEAEREQAAQVILMQAKASILDFLMSTLQMTKKELEQAHVPESADIIRVYDRTINEIESMKEG